MALYNEELMRLFPELARPTGGTSTPGTQPTQSRGILDALKTPEALAAGGIGISGILQSILANRAAGGQQAANAEQANRFQLSNVMGEESDDLFRRQQAHMSTFNMNPIGQSLDLFRGNALRDLAGHGATRVTAQEGVTNPFSVSDYSQGFLAPEALASQAANFYGAAGSLNPNAPAPNLSSLGFGNASIAPQAGLDSTISQAKQRYDTMHQDRRALLESQLQADSQPEEKKKKGGFWGNLLKGIGLGAASFIPGLPAVAAPLLFSAGVGTAVGGARGGAASAINTGVDMGMDYFKRRN